MAGLSRRRRETRDSAETEHARIDSLISERATDFLIQLLPGAKYVNRSGFLPEATNGQQDDEGLFELGVHAGGESTWRDPKIEYLCGVQSNFQLTPAHHTL